MTNRYFHWHASKAGGIKQYGVFKAQSRSQAQRLLKQQGWHRCRVKALCIPKRLSLSTAWITWFYQQLFITIKAGVPLLEALSQMQQLRRCPRWQMMLAHIKAQLEQGSQLSTALESLPRCFTPMECQLLYAGETTGQLESVLDYLVQYRRRMTALKKALIQALTYPLIVILVSLLVTGIMLTVVVPKFAEFFHKANQALPVITQHLMTVSQWLVDYGSTALILLALISFAVVWGYRHHVRWRNKCQHFLLSLPGLRQLLHQHALARSCYTLSLLLRTGIHLNEAFDIIAQGQYWLVLQHCWQHIKISVSQGNALSQALAQYPRYFPNLTLQLVNMGEATGQLDTLLSQLASYYNTSFIDNMKRINSLVEPLSLVVVGAVVALIVTALYLPMFQIGNVM